MRVNLMLKNGHLRRLRRNLNASHSQQSGPIEHTTATSLEKLLVDGTADEDFRMTPYQQTMLALTIASSVIQLRQTSWLSTPFTSKALKFPMHSQDRGLSRLPEPFLEPVLGDRVNIAEPSPKVALLELAILLLEIWHHKPLELWSKKNGLIHLDTQEARTRAAVRWVEMTSQRLPPHHLTAIEQCLAICCGRLRAWDDHEFIKLYCENVITPLQESCKAWYS
jgi:hypothetical protein